MEETTFTLELPLGVTQEQYYELNQTYKIARYIYNSTVKKVINRIKQMKQTKRYRNLIASLTHNKRQDKPIYNELNKLREEYKLTKNWIEKDVKKHQRYFRKHINSQIAQKLSNQIWQACEDYFFGDGDKIHFKKFDSIMTLTGKSNSTGIRFKDNKVYFRHLELSLKRELNNYEWQALRNPISYCRLKRRFIKGKYKFYIQIVLKGQPPVKYDKKTGEVRNYPSQGDVGLDIGTSTIAYASETDVKIIELANKVKGYEDKLRRLQRKLDRQTRANNPNNYNTNGTIKKGRKRWYYSKNMQKTLAQIKEIYRKQTDIRSYQHHVLANQIINLGDKFYVEKMNFKALSKKAKNIEISKKTGKFKRKKRFGKSIGNRAPAKLLSIIAYKLKYYGKELVEIDTISAKASQFNHANETYKKKKLSQRWTVVDGYRVQRDMYSAFLIMNIASDLKSFDLNKCNDRFENFLKLHENEVKRLTGNKNLSSIAI